MTKNLSVDEIKAVAEAAITARSAANAAKEALDNAGGTDEVLTKAHSAAEAAALAAEAAAKALSQDPNLDEGKQKKISKLKRKAGFIARELEELGATAEDDDGEDDDDEDDDILGDDPNRQLTVGDLQKIEARKARKTASQMADTIEDEGQRDAVRSALRRVVPSGDPEKDFQDAVAIASRERNEKILEENERRPNGRRQSPTRTGAAPKVEEQFVATADEQMYMRPPWNLTKKDILDARSKAAKA